MESLKKLTLRLNIPPKIREDLETFLWIKSVWSQIFSGEEDKVWPLSVEKGVLLIAVSDHHKLQNLQFNYLTIFERFRELFSEPSRFPLKKIKFIYRPRKTKEIRSNQKSNPKGKMIQGEDWRKVIELCNQIPDPDLSALFRRTLKNYFNLII